MSAKANTVKDVISKQLTSVDMLFDNNVKPNVSKPSLANCKINFIRFLLQKYSNIDVEINVLDEYHNFTREVNEYGFSVLDAKDII